MAWNTRDFTVAEASQIAGLHRAALDVVISRAKPFASLFSQKLAHRRWFSPRDIAVLRLGYELERAGRNWPTAIAQAFEHLGQPPPLDAILIVPVMSVACTSGRVLTGLTVPLVPSESMIVLPIGRISADIIERCQELKETAIDVAV